MCLFHLSFNDDKGVPNLDKVMLPLRLARLARLAAGVLPRVPSVKLAGVDARESTPRLCCIVVGRDICFVPGRDICFVLGRESAELPNPIGVLHLGMWLGYIGIAVLLSLSTTPLCGDLSGDCGECGSRGSVVRALGDELADRQSCRYWCVASILPTNTLNCRPRCCMASAGKYLYMLAGFSRG